MKGILKKKNFLLKFCMIMFLMAIMCGTFCAYSKFFDVDSKNVNILADKNSNSNNIDYTKLKLKADLSQLTNIDKYNELKAEMNGKSSSQIMDKALKKGIIARQGVIIDIDSLYKLKEEEGKSDSEIVKEAVKKKIIRVLGDNEVDSIDINSLYLLKQDNIDKTDEEIVSKAQNKGIIKGSFSADDLIIDTDLDFTNCDLSSIDLSHLDDTTFLDLRSLKNSSNIGSKTLSDINVKNGQIKTDYDLSLAENPVETPKDDDLQAYDVVVLVDTNMDSNAATNARDAFLHFFFDNSCTQIIAGENHVNFVMIPYHRKDTPKDGWIKYYDSIVAKNINNNNYGDYYRQLITKITEHCVSGNVDMNDTISDGFMKADSYFEEQDSHRTQKSSKVVMVLGSEISETEYDNFKNNLDRKNITGDYGIISLFSGGTDGKNDYNIGYGDTLENMSKAYQSYMYKIHTDLSGLYSNFYISYQHNSGSASHNDIMEEMYSFDGICIGEKMSNSLLNILNGNKSITATANLQFNLGRDIILTPGQSVTSYTQNEEGENIVGIKLENIALKSRYCILGNSYLVVSDDFVNELMDLMLENNHSGAVDKDDVKAYLKKQLSDLDEIQIKDEHAEKIIGNISTQLNMTVGELNTAKGYPLYNTQTNTAVVLNKEAYESVAQIRVLDLLTDNTYNKTEAEIAADKGEEKEKYGVVQNKIKELFRTEVKDRIEKTFSSIIKEKYDKNYSKKEALANAILNNDTETALKEISSIMDYNLSRDNSKIQNVLKNIKEGCFNSDTTLKSLLPQLSVDAKAYLTNADYSKKIVAFLGQDSTSNENLKNVQAEVRSILNQLLNTPLKITQITYSLMEDSSTVSFNIEPTLKAAVDDSVSEVEFERNTNDAEPDKDYVYVTTSDNTASAKNAITTIPILNLNRSLVNKNHIVYGSLGDAEDDHGHAIKEAVKLESESNLDFAKNSVITFAANVTNMNGNKEIRLEVDPDLLITDLEGNTGQVPRIYAYDYDTNALKLVCEMSKQKGTNNIYTSSVDGSLYSNVIVLYSAQTVESEGSYKNVVKVSGLSKGQGIIMTDADKVQPDLF